MRIFTRNQAPPGKKAAVGFKTDLRTPRSQPGIRGKDATTEGLRRASSHARPHRACPRGTRMDGRVEAAGTQPPRTPFPSDPALLQPGPRSAAKSPPGPRPAATAQRTPLPVWTHMAPAPGPVGHRPSRPSRSGPRALAQRPQGGNAGLRNEGRPAATRTTYLEDGDSGRKGGGGAAATALQGPAGCPRQCLSKKRPQSVSPGGRSASPKQGKTLKILSFLMKNRRYINIS